MYCPPLSNTSNVSTWRGTEGNDDHDHGCPLPPSGGHGGVPFGEGWRQSVRAALGPA